MKIGLLSDTHGYLDKNIFKYFEDCDEIWHAGDIGSIDISDQLKGFKKFRAVYGNIDGNILRYSYPEELVFEIEGLKVFIKHIGGYPPKYNPDLQKRLDILNPNLFIFLDTSPENAYRRIKNRARVAESEAVLPIEYLELLYQEYHHFLDQILSGNHNWSSGMKTWVIDWDEDWQSFNPLIKKIIDTFDLKPSSEIKGLNKVKDSICSCLMQD